MSRRLALITGLGLLALVVFWYVALWSPASSALSDANERQDRAEAEARTLRLEASRQDAPDSNDATVANAAAAGLVPDQADLDGLFNLLSQTAASTGVSVQSINPSPPTKPTATDPVTIAVSLQVQGQFHSVQDYLTALQKLPRLFVVDSVSLSAAADAGAGAPMLSANISGRAFAVNLPPDLKPATTTTTAPANSASGANSGK